jgi:hypothetical protein
LDGNKNSPKEENRTLRLRAFSASLPVVMRSIQLWQKTEQVNLSRFCSL